jgi:hypothetical protein
MSTVYLEVDDEITSAIGRIRAVTDGEAVIVVPPGSRIATSRINFKLLVREATERRLNIAAVSDEPGVRALAISAGLPAYDTLVAAEAALATFREQDRRLAERLGRPEPTAVIVAAEPPPTRSDSVPSAPPEDTAIMPAPVARRRRRRRRISVAPLLVVLLMAVLVAGVAYGAYVFLPTATITLQPTTTPVQPGPITVTADPDVAVTDPVAGVVSAQRLEVPVTSSGDFPATGTQVSQTPAHGTVRFRSENTVNAVAITRGTVVSTADGIDFETTEDATVPRADFSTGTPGTVDVAVRAVTAGPRGNVDTNAISVVPSVLSSQLVSVRNPDPTTGGRRVEQTLVAQTDYDAAVATLTGQLTDDLTQALADPQNVPRGLTAFPATAAIGAPEPTPAATDVVGTVATSFTLRLNATATVVAVNESLVDQLAATRLRSGITDAQKIVSDTVDASHQPGSVAGQTVVYQASASATIYSMPDVSSLVASVRGKTVTEAKQILGQYGVVDIVMWPDFIDRLPDQTARINLTVVAPSPGA